MKMGVPAPLVKMRLVSPIFRYGGKAIFNPKGAKKYWSFLDSLRMLTLKFIILNFKFKAFFKKWPIFFATFRLAKMTLSVVMYLHQITPFELM